MAKDKRSHTGHDQNGEGSLLKNLLLLTLPLLSFQRDILPTIRKSLETHKDDHIKAIGNLLSFELHALLMILDPARKLRGRLDDNLENKLKAEITEVLEKLAAGLITVVEIQEKVLPSLIEALRQAKNEKYTSTRKS
jgi:hypothetical protein